jgi:hypothetical protein
MQPALLQQQAVEQQLPRQQGSQQQVQRSSGGQKHSSKLHWVLQCRQWQLLALQVLAAEGGELVL